ncbi:molecular chaperone DnaK [Patescibacteria group bacterium]
MSKIIGIDLGTTNSAMAVVEGGEGQIIENKEGNRTTPSVVAINKSGERLAGLTAKRQAATNPENTLFSAKRFIGRKFSDEDVQQDKDLMPFEMQSGSSGGVEMKMGDKWSRPAEISAMVLQKLKADAEAKLGEEITEAVITVPAYFDDSQRQATKDAGKIAGFEVKRIINEPTAAALAYGFNKKKNEKIVVYDLGGGTFDVSVLEVADDTVEVKASTGDTHLGGDDFDQKVMDWILEEFQKENGVDLSKDQQALQRVKEAAEKAKVELSSTAETEINQPFITVDSSGPKHLNMKLTRAKLEELVGDLAERTMGPLEKALGESKIAKNEINEVILVGGQTRMPLIQEKVKEFFGKEPNKSINPDEVVAIGAALQGGVMQGDVKDVLLLDVTPLSLGIETLGQVNTVLIEKNTTIPSSKTQVFSTAADNQPSVEINVLQGERPMATDNKSLGRFILDGIPPAPRGVPQVEVKFDIDANGILNVSAKDKATGKEQKITITASSGLKDEEIDKMKKDAEAHAGEDKKKRELIDEKNKAESLIFQTEKVLKDAGKKVDDKTKKTIQDKLEALKKVKDGEDKDAIKKASEALSQEIQKIGAQMYQDAQKAQATAGGAKPGDAKKKDDKKDKGDTVEGEVQDKK